MLTITKLKRFLNVESSDTSTDDLLQDCIYGAIAEMDSLTNRILEFRSHIVYLSNEQCCNKLILPEGPISAITSVKHLSDAAYTNILNDPDTCSDSLIFDYRTIQFIKNYSFPIGMRKLLIEYDAGYQVADEWKDTKAYVIGNLVIYNNNIYKCKENHVSAVTFDIAKWNELDVPQVPADLEKAIKYIAAREFYESPAGNDLFMKASMNIGGQSSSGFSVKDIQPYIEGIAEKYMRVNA